MNMYAVRVDKHIEKLRKNGIILSRDDFQVIKDPKWKYSFEIKVDDHIRKVLPFDKWCAITDALTYQHENTARLVDERKHLDELTEKQRETQQKLEEMQAVDSVLADKLTEALQPFRIQWTESMMQWHAHSTYASINGFPKHANNIRSSRNNWMTSNTNMVITVSIRILSRPKHS